MTVDTLNPPTFVYYSISITSDNFKSLSITIFENIHGQDLFLKNEKRPYLPTGSDFFYESDKRSTSYLSHLLWKFQVNPSSHLREIARTKNGKKNNIKKKQYNHYKVFCLKRGTLIIRNKVKTICSQTSFGEDNYDLVLGFKWKNKPGDTPSAT